MNSAFAAAIVRLIVHRRSKDAGHSGMKRVMMGTTQSQLDRKKVLFSDQFFSEDPFCGWWVLLDKPAGSNDIILKELAGVVMAHVDPAGQIAGAIGGPVASVHAAYGTAGQAQTVGSMADGSMASAIHDRWNDAWKAGVWSAAKGTSNEFSIALDYLIMGGFVTMDVGIDGSITGRCNLYTSSDRMMNAMGQAERKGLGASGLKYCREMSEGQFFGSGLSFEYSATTGKITLS